jgi:hypothetical protein
MIYKDFEGNLIFVSPGISGGSVWMTVKQKPGKSGTKRIKSKYLPLRESRDLAQVDLNRWADERKLEVVKDAI